MIIRKAGVVKFARLLSGCAFDTTMKASVTEKVLRAQALIN